MSFFILFLKKELNEEKVTKDFFRQPWLVVHLLFILRMPSVWSLAAIAQVIFNEIFIFSHACNFFL